MEISISGQSIDESLDAYIRTKIGKLDRFLSELDHAKVHLSEEHNPRIADSEKCEITLEGHGNHIRCHVTAPDKRTAIDLAINKLEKQLRKQKTKKLNRWHRGRVRPHHGND